MIKKLQLFIFLSNFNFNKSITTLIKNNIAWLNKNLFNPIKLILVGIFIAYLGQVVLDFINRPKINVEWSNLCLYKTIDDKWIMNSNLKITNSGKEKTAIRVIEILFIYNNPELNKISIPIDATFSIDGYSKYTDEINGVFHNDFDTLTKLPEFVCAEIIYKSFRRKQQKKIKKDSADIGWTFAFGGSNDKNESLGFKEEKILQPLFSPDTISDDLFGVYELFYKGRQSKLLYYPKDYPIEHNLENEKVYIIPIITADFNEIDESQTTCIPTQYAFRSSNKELIDNLVIPSKFSIQIETRDLINNETVINEYEINMMNKKACLYYFFKQQ